MFALMLVLTSCYRTVSIISHKHRNSEDILNGSIIGIDVTHFLHDDTMLAWHVLTLCICLSLPVFRHPVSQWKLVFRLL